MPRHGRSSSRSSGESRSRSRSESSEVEGVRVHVGELPVGCSERDLEHTFKKFGPLVEVWMAKIPPCFAFVVFRDKEDAEEAVRAVNGRTICGRRVRVSIARPRVEARGPRRASYNGDARCYQCGERGHLSRNCYTSRNRRSYSPQRHRPSSSSESAKSRSRSKSREKKSKRKHRSQDKSPDKGAGEEGASARHSAHKSSKRSSSKRHREMDEDETGDHKKEKREAASVRSEGHSSRKASASSEKLVANDNDESS